MRTELTDDARIVAAARLPSDSVIEQRNGGRKKTTQRGRTQTRAVLAEIWSPLLQNRRDAEWWLGPR